MKERKKGKEEDGEVKKEREEMKIGRPKKIQEENGERRRRRGKGGEGEEKEERRRGRGGEGEG